MNWWRKSKERDLERELQSHLDLEAEEQREAGLPPESARLAAQRAFGNRTLTTEVTREAWGWTWIDRLRQDVLYSARTLRRTPGFTLVAVLSLGLGIGANTAIFTLLNAIVLRLLPVPEAHQLVQFTYTLPMWETNPNNWNGYFGYPQFARLREQSKTLSGVFGGTSLGRVNVDFRGTAGLAQADAYTGNFFSVLALTPQAGRFFAEDEDRIDAAVAVISDRYWRNRFAGDPAVIGANVTINQLPFTVIGVAPEDFTGITVGSAPDLWVPLRTLDRFRPDPRRWDAAFTSWLLIAGRLKPGVSLEQSQAELDVIHRRLIREQLESSTELRNSENLKRFVEASHMRLLPAAAGMHSFLRQSYAFPLKLLMAVAGIVLLVACANVANLLLARASSRKREIAVRLAIGASRRRVVRQFLTESLVLATLGGLLGIVIASVGSVALVTMISTGDTPLPLNVTPDWFIFGFAAGISLLTVVLFGLVPAIRGSRVDPAPAMKDGARGTADSSSAWNRGLVMVQVALSVVLVTGAGLFARTLQNLWNIDTGYRRDNVLMFSVDARLGGHPAERVGAIYSEILERMRSLPDTQSASASIVRPVDDHFYLVDRVQAVDGRRLPEADTIRVAWNAISPGYFSTVGTPLLTGREFSAQDDERAPKVVIVNESLAKAAFGKDNPIGRRIDAATVVGLVRDTNYNGVRDKPRPVLYHPLFQYGSAQAFRWGFVSFEIRHRAGANPLEQIRREVAGVDRTLPVFRVRTLVAQTQQALLRERLLAMLATFFGALALALACLGLYGLMAYAVTRRTSEFGIRMALGAGRAHIFWLVVRGTLGLSLAGLILGVPAALWASRFTESLLFGVKATDLVAVLIPVAVLAAVAALAGYLPARRAVRIQPTIALRYE
jgi:predicted permease